MSDRLSILAGVPIALRHDDNTRVALRDIERAAAGFDQVTLDLAIIDAKLQAGKLLATIEAMERANDADRIAAQEARWREVARPPFGSRPRLVEAF